MISQSQTSAIFRTTLSKNKSQKIAHPIYDPLQILFMDKGGVEDRLWEDLGEANGVDGFFVNFLERIFNGFQ